ncbi:glycosyltransferase family 1 protein [Acinetobacter haemolyticus]|uniref:glycosyltransferase family 4 protein n=1 Tax=Acinetobacter haemolyticus TaxID=29430 RepID=UPI0013730F7A|nr:glycosyltransferase family 4 protein [Acinetobacter haemolyticus]NAR64023.1 glycosyltransferase family 1 protein [Acinetobacter haemolyticus]
MEVLIFVSGYPSNENIYNCTWAHTRSLAYLKAGIKPYVLNFGCDNGYVYEGVTVFCEKDIDEILKNNIQTLIMHSPNVRKHFSWLGKIGEEKFKKIIIFCHGTESMFINHDYPKPYAFMTENFLKRVVRDIYDIYKFYYFKKFLKRNFDKVYMVFVSEWMKSIFEKNISKLSLLNSKLEHAIINNSINEVFLDEKYVASSEKYANFITIRRFDESKYAVDLLVSHAFSNPDKTYHLYGKGAYFKYNEKPKNLQIFDNFVKPEEIPALLNHYDCAFMPTRCDAQGVMMCEMASYGIPLVTNKIDITQEMLSTFNNVIYFEECEFNKGFDLKRLSPLMTKNLRFSDENTAQKEVVLLKSLGGN